MSAIFNTGDRVRLVGRDFGDPQLYNGRVGTIMGPSFEYLGTTVFPVDFGNTTHVSYTYYIPTLDFDKSRHWIIYPQLLELVSENPAPTVTFKEEPMV